MQKHISQQYISLYTVHPYMFWHDFVNLGEFYTCASKTVSDNKNVVPNKYYFTYGNKYGMLQGSILGQISFLL